MNRASSSSDVARIPAAPLIEVTGLSKRYGDQIAIKDVSFVASAGEIVGIIGPNGAGKTTLLETLAGLIPADSGVLSGEHVAQAGRRNTIFYVPDGLRPYQDHFAADVLSFFAGVYWQSAKQISDVVGALGLESVLTLIAEHKSDIFIDPDSVRDASISAPKRGSMPTPPTIDAAPDLTSWRTRVKANARNRMGGYTGKSLTAVLIVRGQLFGLRSGRSEQGVDLGSHWCADHQNYEPFPEIEGAKPRA